VAILADELAAADLTAAYHGWSIRLPVEAGTGYRQIKLGGIRHWSHNGSDFVGVLDTDDASGSIRGTEHQLLAATVCLPMRKLHASRPRRDAYPS